MGKKEDIWTAIFIYFDIFMDYCFILVSIFTAFTLFYSLILSALNANLVLAQRKFLSTVWRRKFALRHYRSEFRIAQFEIPIDTNEIG